MSTTSAPASAAPRTAAAQGAQSKIHRENFGANERPADAFAQLLHLQADGTQLSQAVEDTSQSLGGADKGGGKKITADSALEDALAEHLSEQRRAAAAMHAPQPIDAATASLADLAGTLLGQTRALDARAQTAQLQGQAAAQARAHGFGSALELGAQGALAQSLGAGVATVAAGVELSETAAARESLAQLGADAAVAERQSQSAAAERLFAATSVARLGAGAALHAGQASVQDGVTPDGAALGEATGAFELGAGWDLMPEDAQSRASSAEMQRAVAQVGAFAQQWLAGGARGAQARAGEKPVWAEVEGLSAADAAAAQAAGTGAGSGLRTLAQSIAEAAQSQSAQFAQSQQPEGGEQAAMHDMRYWLNGKNQRAALQIQHRGADGQLHNVRVQVDLAGDQTRVHFASADEGTRQTLQLNQGELRELLAQSGLQLQSVEVAQEQGAALASGFAGDGQGSSGSHDGGQQTAARAARIVAPVGEGADAAAVSNKRASAGGVDLYA